MRNEKVERDWDNLAVLARGRARSRSYFIPYSDRAEALSYDRGSSSWFRSYTTYPDLLSSCRPTIGKHGLNGPRTDFMKTITIHPAGMRFRFQVIGN